MDRMEYVGISKETGIGGITDKIFHHQSNPAGLNVISIRVH